MSAVVGRGSPLQGRANLLAETIYGVWALLPEKLLELQAIYETHLRGEKIDIKAIEAQIGRPLANQQRGYEVVNGIAVLGLQGAISPKANLFSQISGGASAQIFMRDLNAAGADTSVRGAIIAADTPGGNVLGIPAAREAVRNFGAVKPIVTHSDGQLASAGFWIGRAANRVYIADSMVQVGSIGVVYTHTDTSAAEAKAGVKKTVITAGKYKRKEGPDGKLSPEGQASLQETADYVYSVFVGNTAEDLGVSVDTVLEHMADGRVFIGQQAIDAGLVDGVSTIDALIEQMATNPAAFSSRRKAVVKGAGSSKSTRAVAAPTPPRALTPREMADKVAGHAKEHGISIVAAYKALGFDVGAQVSDAARGANAFRELNGYRAEMATAHAKKHGVTYVAALKALGFAR